MLFRGKATDFFRIEMPPLALGKITQGKRADGNADQAQYADTLRVQQTPNVAIASFVQHDFQPCVFLAAAQQRHLRFAASCSPLSDDALDHLIQQRLASGMSRSARDRSCRRGSLGR